MRPDILTQGGSYFDFLKPEESDFSIIDIAHALSHICRFTGHTREFYSVAQHSVLVSHWVPADDAFAGLMHDAAEAFIGDVAKPLKQLLPEYKVIEDRVEAEIFRRYGLPAKLPVSVKRADLVLLAAEKRCLMPEHHDTWDCIEGLADEAALIQILPVSPATAKAMFLQRFAELRK